MTKKDFITLTDYKAETLVKIIKRAIEFKKGSHPSCEAGGKVLAMIFTKPSTRTNVSFFVAMQRLGGQAMYLGSEALQLSRGETIGDTAKTLSRYVDAVIIRTFSHFDAVALSESASVPVINGLTDLLHPCQALGDVMTICEKKGFDFNKIKMVYIGDGNNVCNSLINAAGVLGFKLTVASPEGFEPSEDVFEKMEKINPDIRLEKDPHTAVSDADVIYTDVWVSMGDEDEEEIRKKTFSKYQVNKSLVSKAKKDFIVMHCLPANRGEEITDEIMDGKNSAIFDQAENRLHIQQALLEYLFKESEK